MLYHICLRRIEYLDSSSVLWIYIKGFIHSWQKTLFVKIYFLYPKLITSFICISCRQYVWSWHWDFAFFDWNEAGERKEEKTLTADFRKILIGGCSFCWKKSCSFLTKLIFPFDMPYHLLRQHSTSWDYHWSIKSLILLYWGLS